MPSGATWWPAGAPRWTKAREADLRDLKQQGRVGETVDGCAHVVDDKAPADEPVTKLVGDQNTARTAEYAALAAKEHVDAAAIAKRMAKRNFDNARVGDMLKDENGSWRRK